MMTKVKLTSVKDVLTKKEIDYIVLNQDRLLELHQCHKNAFTIASILGGFGEEVEFCEGCLMPYSGMEHCWNRVRKNGKWYYIDCTKEILNSLDVTYTELYLFETWDFQTLAALYLKEKAIFIPFCGMEPKVEKGQWVYTSIRKGADGKPVKVKTTDAKEWSKMYEV